MKKKQRKSIESPALRSLGPFFTATVNDHERVRAIIDAINTFGGQPYARIYRDELNGHKATIVSLRYTNLRAHVGELDQTVAQRLRWTLFWASLFRRAITTPAELVTDPESPEYLGVWANARAAA